MEERTKGGESSGEIKLDLGLLELTVTLSVRGVQTLTGTLEESLREPMGTLGENVGKIVDAVQQLGVENLRNWAERGGPEEKNAFNQLISVLQRASERGQKAAANLVRDLGGMPAGAGRAAKGEDYEKGPGARH